MSYRTDGVEIVGTFQYNDSANDHFEREPYSVLIRSREEEGKIEIVFLVLCRPHPLMAHDKHICCLQTGTCRGQSSFIKACSFGMLGVEVSPVVIKTPHCIDKYTLCHFPTP